MSRIRGCLAQAIIHQCSIGPSTAALEELLKFRCPSTSHSDAALLEPRGSAARQRQMEIGAQVPAGPVSATGSPPVACCGLLQRRFALLLCVRVVSYLEDF